MSSQIIGRALGAFLGGFIAAIHVNRVRAPRTSNEDFDLRVDDQVVQFLQARQRLSYFIITGAVAVIAFVVSFVAANTKSNGAGISLTTSDVWLITLGAIAGLLAAGATLLSVHLGHQSFALHLGHRYDHLGYRDLQPPAQKAWDRISSRARRLLFSAFSLFFLEIVLMLAFFVHFFYTRVAS